MLTRKFRQLGKVLGNARWWPFYFQRRFMSAGSRDGFARAATLLRPDGEMKVSDEVRQESQSRLEALRSRGISHFGAMLTGSQSSDLRDYFNRKPVSDAYRPGSGSYLPDSDARHPESHTAHHEPRDVVMAPYLLQLANHPAILRIAAEYLGCRPTLGYLTAWWSYPTGIGAQHAENFHRDVDDWRFLKLFVYLTDVGNNNGPHIYVAGSSASNKLRVIARFQDSQVIEAFGKPNVLELTGNAGTGFLEDTFGIHKGQPVKEGRRLMFSAVYSMFPLPYGPKRPVATHAEVEQQLGFQPDPWVNRLYLSARG